MASSADLIGSVRDPLLNRPLAELDMVGGVEEGFRGLRKVLLRLPVPNYPEREELDRRVRAVLDGDRAEVSMSVMDDAERTAMMTRLRDEAGPRAGQSGSRARVLAVSSGKGGVGKSTVTANLAVALGAAGNQVGVIDADIWGFSIPRMLGVTRPPVVIAEAIIPPLAHGVKVMSMDYFVGDEQAVIWRGPMLHKALEQFLTDVFWDRLDFLLVDMPPGTGDVAISMSQFLPRAEVLLVTTPQPTAERVARRAALMAAKVEQEVIGVVENMSWFTDQTGERVEMFGRGGGADLAAEVGVPLLARIPLVPAVREGADAGIPARVAAPGSEADEAFNALAERVMERKPRIRRDPQLVIKS
jgi:ATP-binding protein involved in chromosome partitioning